MEWAVEKRRGKVFIDYGQNVQGKTLASVYSPRPDPEAAVSTPLHWEELCKVYPSQFSILTLPDRLKKIGDLWADILDAKHDLKKILDEMWKADQEEIVPHDTPKNRSLPCSEKLRPGQS